MPKSFVYKQLPSNKLAIGKKNLPGFFYGAYKVFYEAYKVFLMKDRYCSSTNQITIFVTIRI